MRLTDDLYPTPAEISGTLVRAAPVGDASAGAHNTIDAVSCASKRESATALQAA
jgi:hypothetical protein